MHRRALGLPVQQNELEKGKRMITVEFTREELENLANVTETVWRAGQVASSAAGVKMLSLQSKIAAALNGGAPVEPGEEPEKTPDA